ncbi:hypothetical protein [Sorangium sp. So ce1335]|uniref:hypothetical protein n=1 Tax=Sorangium sp. So ce1335 TaxID=3133335 RepID=UPI003F621CAA
MQRELVLLAHCALLASLVPAAAGCAAGAEELGASPGDEDIAEASLAACTDPASSLGGSNNFYSTPIGAGSPGTVYSSSPTTTYGSAACSTAYVFEVTGLAGSYPHIYAIYDDVLPTSQSECEISGVTATAYGWVPPHCNGWTCYIGRWEQLADPYGDTTPTDYGHWVPDAGHPNGGYCTTAKGGAAPWVVFEPNTTKYSTVRVAGSAFTFFLKKKVMGMVARW